MKSTPWRKRLLESTRGQILNLLRTRDHIVNELAAELGLTDNAVRAHLLSLERDVLVQQSGKRAGLRKPHVTYGLTPAAEQIFPKAYGYLISRLMSVFSRKVSQRTLRSGMREIGHEVAKEHRAEVEGKNRKQRIQAALRVLKELGGAATFHENEGRDFIRGNGCPLAAATANHPEACLIAESLLSDIIGAPVKERCMRGATPSCRFEIK